MVGCSETFEMGVSHSPPRFQGILHLKMASVSSFQARNFAVVISRRGLENLRGSMERTFLGAQQKILKAS